MQFKAHQRLTLLAIVGLLALGQSASAQALLWEYKAPIPIGIKYVAVDDYQVTRFLRGASGVVASMWAMDAPGGTAYYRVILLSARGKLIGNLDLPLEDYGSIVAVSATRVSVLQGRRTLRTYAVSRGKFSLVNTLSAPSGPGETSFFYTPEDVTPPPGARDRVLFQVGSDDTSFWIRCYSAL